MSRVPFATRLPESKRDYLRYKAMCSGMQQQDLLTEIIDFYQQHDAEFMTMFETLRKSGQLQPEEVNNDT